MSGEIGSTAKQRLDEFQERLRDYIQKTGIVVPAPLVEDCEHAMQILPQEVTN